MVSKIVSLAKRYTAPIAVGAAVATFSPAIASIAAVACLVHLGSRGKLSQKTAVYFNESTQLNPFAQKTDALEIAEKVHGQAVQALAKSAPVQAPAAPAPPVIAPQREPPAQAPAAPPYAWRPETKRQIEDLSIKLSCLTTLSTMNWICGVNTPSETLMQLSAEASKNTGTLWSLFKSQQKLSLWQWAVGGVVYLFSGIIDTIVKTYVSTICTEMVHQATQQRDPKDKAKMTRSFLSHARDFLTAYNKITEDFAKGECGTLSLQAAQMRKISSEYGGSEKSFQEIEKSKALRSLCERFVDTLLSEYSPSVSEYGRTGNWLIRKLIRRTVPAQLQSLVASGVDYTNPQNLSFAIQREKFLAKQLGNLQTTLSSGASGPAPQIEGIEELPTVVAELFKMIVRSKKASDTSLEDDTKESVANRIQSKSRKDALLKKYGQVYIVLGCKHILDYLSNPQHIEEIIHNLSELMLESFAPNQVQPDLLVQNFEPSNLIKDIDEENGYVSQLKQLNKIKDVFGPGPLRAGMEAQVDGILFRVETSGLISYKISLERLQKMKTVAGENLQTASSDCFKQIAQKVSGATRDFLGESKDTQAMEQNAETILKTQQRSAQGIAGAFPVLRQKAENFETIQPEIALFFEQLTGLTNVKALKSDLNKLPRPEKEAIVRALRPLYVGSEELLTLLTDLQTTQDELTELQNEEKKQTELLHLVTPELQVHLVTPEPQNPFTLLNSLKAWKEEAALEQMKQPLDLAQNWLDGLENIQTELNLWKNNASLFNRYPKSYQIGKVIESLPSGEDKDTLLRMAADLWKEKVPAQILIRYNLFIRKIEAIREKSQQQKTAQIEEAINWMRAKKQEIENSLKFLPGQKHGKKEELLAKLKLVENSVVHIRKEIEQIQMSPYSRWSNKDLVKLGVNGCVGALISWFAPAAAFTSPFIVEASAEKVIPDAAEKWVFSEISDLAFRAYEQLGSPLMSYAIATRSMKSFVDGKAKTLV